MDIKPVESELKDSKDEVVQPTQDDVAVEVKPETTTDEKKPLTWWQATLILATPAVIGAVFGLFAGIFVKKAIDKKKGDVNDVPEKG